MQRFTNPRDIYHGKGALEALKTFEGKKAVICVGGGSMKRFGFLDRAKAYLEDAGMEVKIFEGIEPDPSVETVMKGAAFMAEFEPDIRSAEAENKSSFLRGFFNFRNRDGSNRILDHHRLCEGHQVSDR